MPIHNADIAAIFEEIADLLEIEGANPFRIRAYRNAARVVGEYGRELRALLENGGDLPRLPGIGTDLAGKIREIVTTGHCALLERLRGELPTGVTALLKIPGLGPKKVSALYHDLAVETPEQLLRMAREGRIRQLHGFGEKTEASILHAIEAYGSKARRYPLAAAAQHATALVAYLRSVPGVHQVTLAGSYRRRKETVGDLDILVSAASGSPVIQRFVGYDEVAEALSGGTTRASVTLKCGLQVDLRLVEDASYGAALEYFTGSRPHTIAIRTLARERGLKVNEYGVFQGEARIAGETEESVYAAVGLPWIAPELREDRGEIEAARAGRLPRLIELADLRGDLHAHTMASDGHASLHAMALAARAQGLEYLAITDHCGALKIAHGLDPQRLRRQLDEIDRLNAELAGITLLKGCEVEILEDGSLDLPEGLAGRLDIVIGALHSHFGLPRAKQTRRILRAMDHPRFTLLAHPFGRLINEREPIEVDMQRIIRHAHLRGCWLELNAQPQRLDLPDTWCRMAKAEGALVAVNSDAHGTAAFDDLAFGIGQARRGWLAPGDVVNTRNLADLKSLIAATM
ncbi:DNA polymerase/3'-5' exonuclease PolX [Sulfuriferula plumbiphila]|uniref:DNA polymerase beta n=1 Tax=Sulfuriferula plumbiphila TaxID=171865 RepID=A0A512L5G3_9PROT|nr:DNA polymerase/3'-5' exonuclease PolX [Sulfuriferula plumbiphila]BBP03537.1 DNA polymerase/3'-5' exonuclease PolX [Sulfuriferula plumbiphila]GEP29692.1 DNA polymerase/3'-5' exonuclease PolX [Sulfuriferula plumbiphila]